MKAVELGKTYRDRATGVYGVAVSRTEHLGGEVTTRLEWRGPVGEVLSSSFAEQRLDFVDGPLPGMLA